MPPVDQTMLKCPYARGTILARDSPKTNSRRSYYRARYYDPNSGRFMSEDRLRGISGGVDFYPYVGSSPTNLVDPSGLCPGPTCPTSPDSGSRLVPISDCVHNGDRRVVYELQRPDGTKDSCWWVTEHQEPKGWAPPGLGSPEGQSTGDQNNGPGGFDDTVQGINSGRSKQTFTVSPQDPRLFPNTPSFPVIVRLPSGPNGQTQDFGTLGIWHGGKSSVCINGNCTGWVPYKQSYEVSGW
jgi:RHS repeat-associated protein